MNLIDKISKEDRKHISVAQIPGGYIFKAKDDSGCTILTRAHESTKPK